MPTEDIVQTVLGCTLKLPFGLTAVVSLQSATIQGPGKEKESFLYWVIQPDAKAKLFIRSGIKCRPLSLDLL